MGSSKTVGSDPTPLHSTLRQSDTLNLVDVSGKKITTGDTYTASIPIPQTDGSTIQAEIDYIASDIPPSTLIIGRQNTVDFQQHHDDIKDTAQYTTSIKSNDGSTIPLTLNNSISFNADVISTPQRKTMTSNQKSKKKNCTQAADTDICIKRISPSRRKLKEKQQSCKQRVSCAIIPPNIVTHPIARTKSIQICHETYAQPAIRAGGSRTINKSHEGRQQRAAATNGYTPGEHHSIRELKRFLHSPANAKMLQTSLLLSAENLNAAAKHCMWADVDELDGETLFHFEDVAKIFSDNTRNKHSHGVQAIAPMKKGDRVHTDVYTNNTTSSGTGNVTAKDINTKDRFFGTNKYIVFTDEATRYTRQYPLQDTTASTIFAAIKDYIRDEKLQSRTEAIELQCDKATYYTSKTMDASLKDINVIQKFSQAKEGSTNGLAERTVGWIKQYAAHALQQANLNDEFFGLAAEYVIFIKNRSPHSTLMKNGTFKTPYELAHGVKPSVRNIPAFGTPCTVIIDHNTTTTGKDHVSPIRAVFTGMSSNSNSYRILQLETFSGRILDESSPSLKVKISEQSPIRVKLDRWWCHPYFAAYPESIIRDRLLPQRMQHIQTLYETLKGRFNFDRIQTTDIDGKEIPALTAAKETLVDMMMMDIVATAKHSGLDFFAERALQNMSHDVAAATTHSSSTVPQHELLTEISPLDVGLHLDTSSFAAAFTRSNSNPLQSSINTNRIMDRTTVYLARATRKDERMTIKHEASLKKNMQDITSATSHPNHHDWDVGDTIQYYTDISKMTGVGTHATILALHSAGILELQDETWRSTTPSFRIHHSHCRATTRVATRARATRGLPPTSTTIINESRPSIDKAVTNEINPSLRLQTFKRQHSTSIIAFYKHHDTWFTGEIIPSAMLRKDDLRNTNESWTPILWSNNDTHTFDLNPGNRMSQQQFLEMKNTGTITNADNIMWSYLQPLRKKRASMQTHTSHQTATPPEQGIFVLRDIDDTAKPSPSEIVLPDGMPLVSNSSNTLPEDAPTAFSGVPWQRPHIRKNAIASDAERTRTLECLPTPTGDEIAFDYRDDAIFNTVAKVGIKVDKKSLAARAAEKKEIDGLREGEVLRPLTKTELRELIKAGHTTVPLIMILDHKLKQMTDGQVHEYIKARLCANGKHQEVDRCDKSSPAPSQDAIRLFIANAQHNGQELYVLDYSQAYIQGSFKRQADKVIGVYQGQYFLIEKPLYGLKTSGALWRDEVVKIYEKLGFVMDKDEPCIFRRTTDLGTTSIIIYVDDVMYACSTEAARQQFEHDVSNTGNKLTLMGRAIDFAGYSMTRLTKGGLHLSSTNSIAKMEAKHLNLFPDKHVFMPWQSDTVRDNRDTKHVPIPLTTAEILLYQSLVGTFTYVVSTTRPECCTVYSRLASRSRDPTNHDMEDAIHMAMYLRDTRYYGIVYPWRSNTMHQEILTDANHGDKRDPKQRARTGALIYLGGCLVAWTSHKQTTSLIGSRDAEWIAAADGLHLGETISFMQDKYETKGAPLRPTTILHTDNEVMLKQLQKGSVPTVQRLAMFRAPQVKSYFENKAVIFYKIHTKDNTSDLLTKETPRATFNLLAGKLVTNVNRHV